MGSAAAGCVKADRTITADRTTVASPYNRLQALAVLVLTVETVSTKVTTGEQPSGRGRRWQTARGSRRSRESHDAPVRAGYASGPRAQHQHVAGKFPPARKSQRLRPIDPGAESGQERRDRPWRVAPSSGS